jgi:hypothetical protein
VPVLDLFVSPPLSGSPAPGGNLDLDPPVPGLNRILLRQLVCSLRVPPIPGAYEAVIDTGAPLSVFPHALWYHPFGWRVGRDFDELSVAGIGTTLQGQVLGYRYSCRLARLRVPVELAGRDPKGARLRLDALVCQLADTGGPPFVLLGLWGGALTGRRLAIEPQPDSDDLVARLDF